MGSQVDKSFPLQDLPKLREGERVEVRQKDVGLRGSWHPGTIVALKTGHRVVEYDELLTDDGISKLRETIPCAKAFEKFISSPGICTPQKNAALLAPSTRSPARKRGLLRPSPPTCLEPCPLTWKSGLYVDVFYQDAWWEAVLLSDVTSLDDNAFVEVIYPDEGDQARVRAKDLRISQFWDEATGKWNVKGSTDLTKFLRRRRFDRKEVNLMLESEHKGNGQNSCANSKIMDCEKELIQMCPPLDRGYEGSAPIPLTVKEAIEKPLHTHLNIGLDSVSRDEENNPKLPLTNATNGDMVLDSSALKDNLDTLMSFDGKELVVYEESQKPINGDFMVWCNEKNANGHGCATDVIEKEDLGECLPSPLAEKKLIYNNSRSKRRRIEDTCAISCEREAIYTCPQPTASSPLKKVFPESHNLQIIKLNCEEPQLSMERSLDGGSTSYPGMGRSRRRSNLKGSRKDYSAKLLQENAMQLSIVSEESGLSRKRNSRSLSRGILNGERTYEKKNKLLGRRPACRQHLLALEAPVRKSLEEYEQITAAGKAALGSGVHETVMKPARQTGEKVLSRKAGKQDDCILTAGKLALVEGMHVRGVRSGRQSRKFLPFEKLQDQRDLITSAAKAGSIGVVDERVVRTRRLAVKEGSVQKSQGEDNQLALAEKGESVHVRSRSGRRAQAEMPVQGSQEENHQTLSSGKALLEEDVHERVKRRAVLSGRKALGWKSGEKHNPIMSEKATPQVDGHERVLRFGGQAGEFSKLVDKAERRGRKDTLKLFKERLLRQKQSDALKRKASCMSSVPGLGGKSWKVLRLSRPHRDSKQPAAGKLKLTSDGKEKGLKHLAREIGIRAVVEAGYTLQYKLRKEKLSTDTIYTSPKGYSYWSLPKAWSALNKNERKGRLRVEKAVVQQVLAKIDSDDRMRSAFEKLDRFSGRCLQDVMRNASFTYEELTDILLEDLHVLKKEMPFRRQKKGLALSKSLSAASESSSVKKRGRKRKQDVEARLQEVHGRASTSKPLTDLETLLGGHVHKLEMNKSVLKEGKPRKWLKGVKKAPVNKSSSLIKALADKSRKKSRGSSKSAKSEVRTPHQESHKTEEKAEKPRSGFRLEVRPSSLSTEDDSEDLSCHSMRTVTSWMIDRGAVLEKERIFCADKMSNEILKEGVLTREGILCRCCKMVYTVQNFEDHGRSQEGFPDCKLIFTSGRSFLDCQLEAWNVEVQIRKTQNYKGVTPVDTNDDTCLLCGDGGSLLCCDLCPSTFHASCLQLEDVPEGNWYCPKCRCGVCRDRSDNEDEVAMAVCKQCEHRYHIACLCGGHTIVENKFFCGNLCRKIYLGLRNLVGVTHSLDRGFSWTLLRCTEESDCPGSKDIELAAKSNSKLAVALLVLKECFNPMDDPRTNIDMITHAVFNRWSQFDRLNYVGFYTAVLERDDEIISVASIRIHGARIAEMPLIGTRHKYRRQGMCRLLVGVIEKLLCSLEVGVFILPAISELFETWTKAFGFRPLDFSQRSDIKDLSMMIFPGTDLLQKPMQKSSTEDAAVLQICDPAAELRRNVEASSLDCCQELQKAGSGRMKAVETNSSPPKFEPEPLVSDNGDDDVFFDACLNLQSTDLSVVAEKGTGSLLNLPSESPTCGGSLSAKLFTKTYDRSELHANLEETHPGSSGEGDFANVKGLTNKAWDDGGQQDPEVDCMPSKDVCSLVAKNSVLAKGDAEVQKMKQDLDHKQVNGGCNGSSNAEFISHDTCEDGSQQSEPSNGLEQTSRGGAGIKLRNREISLSNSDSAEPMLTDSATSRHGGVPETKEMLESGCRLTILKPSVARNGGFVRSEPSVKVLGTDPPAHFEDRGATESQSQAQLY